MTVDTAIVVNFLRRAEKIEELAIALETELADLDDTPTAGNAEDVNPTLKKKINNVNGDLRREIKQIDEEREMLKDENKNLRAQVSKMSALISKNLKGEGEERDKRRKRIAELEKENAKLTLSAAAAKKDTLIKAGNHKGLKQTIKELREEKTQLIVENESLRTENEALREEQLPDGLDRATIFKTLSMIREDVVKLTSEKALMEKENKQLHEKLTKTPTADGEVDKEQVVAILTKIREDFIVLQEENEELKAQINNSPDKSKLKEKLKDMRSELEILKEQAQNEDERNKKSDIVLKGLVNLRAEFVELQAQNDKLKRENGKLQKDQEDVDAFKKLTYDKLSVVRELVVNLEARNKQLNERLDEKKKRGKKK